MPVTTCPQCGAKLRYSDQAQASQVSCPKCHETFGLPIQEADQDRAFTEAAPKVATRPPVPSRDFPDRPVSRHAPRSALVGFVEISSASAALIIGPVALLCAPLWVPWLVSRDLWGPVISPLIFVAALAVAVPFALSRWRKIFTVWKKYYTSVDLYPDRMVCRLGGGATEIPWEEVRYIFQRVTHLRVNFVDAGLKVDVTVELESGDRWEFGNSLSDAGLFADNLARLSERVLLDNTRARLQAGALIDFGPKIQADADALVVKGTPHDWAAVTRAEIRNGHLVLEVDQSPPVVVEAGSIANIHVLLPLIKELSARGPE